MKQCIFIQHQLIKKELRKVIEERKRKELESRIAKKKEFEQEMSKDNKQKPKTAKKEVIINRGRDSR